VDIDVPFPQADLTLNSFFHADSVWTATLTLNKSILDVTPRKRIENGLVIIYHEDIPIDTLEHIVNGVYRSDSGKPIPGNTYEIRATAEGYNPVSGRSYAPVPAEITKVEVIDGTTIEGYPESTIRVTFTDDPESTNYYQIFLEAETDFIIHESGQVGTSRARLGIESDDPAVQNNDEIGYDGLFMKDILFNGSEGIISFKTTGSNIQHYQHVIATVRTLSTDHYNYKISGSLQQNTSDNPFAQPVNVYDNIEDGFGIFAGFSEYHYAVGEPPPRPVINSISPMRGKAGDHVIIQGENFWELAAYTGTVIFSGDRRGVPAQIVNATSTELEVIIPQIAITGKIFVGNLSRMTVSDDAFEIIK
jgi:hypothetical protein